MDFTTAVNDIIRDRRSIYTNMFSGEVVDDAIIETMLENANWAPNHKHTEPWRFVVFKGEGIKKLGEFQANFYKESNPDTFDQNKYDKLYSKPLECSHVIALGMKKSNMVPEVEEVCATACAVQNMLLTAAANKIGCYWSTGGITFQPKAKSFFALGDEDQLLGFLYIGMPKSDKWPAGKRKPIDEKVKWVVE